MTKLSGKKSKKMIYFKMYRSLIYITQNFMLIPMQKTVLHVKHSQTRFTCFKISG